MLKSVAFMTFVNIHICWLNLFKVIDNIKDLFCLDSMLHVCWNCLGYWCDLVKTEIHMVSRFMFWYSFLKSVGHFFCQNVDVMNFLCKFLKILLDRSMLGSVLVMMHIISSFMVFYLDFFGWNVCSYFWTSWIHVWISCFLPYNA